MVQKLAPNDMVEVYALRDIVGPRGNVLVEAGDFQLVFTVDARERVSRHPKDWSLQPPGESRRPRRAATPEGDSDGPLSALGLNRKVVHQLNLAGYNDLESLRDAEVSDLTALKGIGERIAESIVDQVANTLADAGDGEED